MTTDSLQQNDKTRIPLDVIHDHSLSFKARGIYAAVCSLQQHEGIEFPTVEDIKSFTNEGRDSIKSGLKELRDVGLIPPKPPFPATRRPGFVYFIYCPQQELYKVGCSADPEVRLQSLRRKTKTDLQIFKAVAVSDMGATEAYLHSVLRNKRVTGEWFKLSIQEIEQACMGNRHIDVEGEG